EVLGRPVDGVKLFIGRSDFGSSTGSGGSKTTATVTPAVRAAAEALKDKLTALAAQALGRPATEITWEGDTAHAKKHKRSIAWAELCKKIEGEALTATGTRPKTYGHHPMRFLGGDVYQIAGVQFAEVEVDTWTGVCRATRVLAVHDCGRVMNELTLRSQINGGIILGTGYALMEQRVMDPRRGVMLNANLDAYKCLGARDVPAIDILLTEVHTGANNTGAIGIGEPATIPTAAAIAGAVYDALGVAVRDLPITPDRVLTALGAVS
ncbi:MAG: xanthine dehydrogenase family protein molybdopterin-binding subunit, partial [Myxococcales bacterium]|nr:xanthine dehydrogenase family protein molybdopterin-binding subunit [Myxococcales bacterium]